MTNQMPENENKETTNHKWRVYILQEIKYGIALR